MQVPVSSCYAGSCHSSEGGIYCSSFGSVKRIDPFVNLRMSIGKGKPTRPVMIGRGLIHPGVHIRIEQTCIIDAAGMLVAVYPGVCWAGVNKFTHLFNVFVYRIPWTTFGIAFTNPNVARHTSRTLSPAAVPLA